MMAAMTYGKPQVILPHACRCEGLHEEAPNSFVPLNSMQVATHEVLDSMANDDSLLPCKQLSRHITLHVLP